MRVGQKVVCVHSFLRVKDTHNIHIPMKGEIYTIRALIESGGKLWALLEEIVNQPRNYSEGFHEAAWEARAFRPVDETFGEQVCERIEEQFEKQLQPA